MRLIFIATLGFFVMSSISAKTEPESELTFFNTRASDGKGLQISFDPALSDVSTNQTVLVQVIGTLARVDMTSKLTPYIAESWKISEDGRQWKFKIRENLKCEDGTPITARGYVKGLNSVAKIYAQKKDQLVVFNKLQGWPGLKNFRNKPHDLEGVIASEDVVTFNFVEKPIGFFPYLAMPYFGYYCPKNFDTNGNWLDPQKAVSSDAYRIEAFKGNVVTLKARKDWFSRKVGSADRVKVKYSKLSDAIASKAKYKAIISQKVKEDKRPSDLVMIESFPSMLSAINITIARDNVFQIKSVRHAFRDYLRINMAKLYVKGSLFDRTDQVFHAANPISSLPRPPKVPSIPSRLKEKEVIWLYPSSKGSEWREFLRHSIVRTFENLGLKYKLVDDYHLPDWSDRAKRGKYYDIRVTFVETGGTAQNWVAHMMWCSKMGVGFPDPSGKVCELIKARGKKYNDEFVDARYLEKLKEYVDEDATVVPMVYSNHLFFFTKNIDLEKYNVLNDHIYFKDLVLK
ncbi:ABC transporter substrate-binding protein [Pseudobacteriovorax antillogorgiicola]|uniref:ABC-type transport system, substrate-binding protein n=1 Tax=Pseudobacteriovorax antillogorgiicola TaxID=1513793 RepID=A0A1Y6BYM7_9BACT|nr:ABC transporter substrate-binding protein [Pseudobacteriovorax antillogorgiicola]TCS43390.1 ABC-type transport system substrate-binding protein [Pseudobacteriovorax antillogorgiicola]SMF34919.1 ABC-type transport system, substrate-binding protein [Pseudobacteriovorax antillogorgiicola]